MDVMGDVKPNGTLSNVVDNSGHLISGLTKKDVLVVMAGTNDVYSELDESKFIDQVKYLLELSKCTQLIFVGLPYRRDVISLNNLIASINCNISRLISKTNHAKFLSLESMYSPRLYTKFGLHLNTKGKIILAKKLYDVLAPSPTPKPPTAHVLEHHPIPVVPSNRFLLKQPIHIKPNNSTFKTRVFTNKAHFLGVTYSTGRGP